MDLKNYIMDKKEYSLGLIPMFEESSIMSFLDKTHIDYDYDSIHSQRILTINTKLLKEETVRKVHKLLTETYGCKEGCVKEVDGNGLKETPTDEKLKETLE